MTVPIIESFNRRTSFLLKRTASLAAWEAAHAAFMANGRGFMRSGGIALITAALAVTTMACRGPVWLSAVWGACTGWMLVSTARKAVRFVRAHEAEQKAIAAYEAIAGKRKAS